MLSLGNPNLSFVSGYLVNSVHMIKAVQVTGVSRPSIDAFVSIVFQEYKNLIKTLPKE